MQAAACCCLTPLPFILPSWRLAGSETQPSPTCPLASPAHLPQTFQACELPARPCPPQQNAENNRVLAPLPHRPESLVVQRSEGVCHALHLENKTLMGKRQPFPVWGGRQVVVGR